MNTNTWSNKLILISILIMATLVVGCGGSSGGGDGDSGPVSFQVKSISPAQGETGVARDKDIRVTFTYPLDSNQVTDIITAKDSSGETISGKVIINQKTLSFHPDRYQAGSLINITVSATARSGDLTLGENYEASFTTGNDLVGGKMVPPDAYNPLGSNGLEQISLNKIPEVTVIWNRNSVKRFAVQDPPYNPNPMANPKAPNGAAIIEQNYNSLEQQKIPVSGQFDNDQWDETAVFSYDYDGTTSGVIGLTIFDTTGDKQIVEIDTGLAFGSTDTYAAGSGESVDLATADFDGDGRDEIIIATTKRSRKNIEYYIIDYNPESTHYEILKQGVIATQYPLNSVKLAAGDVDGDGKVETVLAWIADWEESFTGIPDQPMSLGASYYVILDDIFSDSEMLIAINENDYFHAAIQTIDVCPYDYIDVAVGDVDRDGVAEVIFATTDFRLDNDNKTKVTKRLYLAQNIASDQSVDQLETNLISELTNVAFEFQAGEKSYLSVLQLADIDGDSQKEILFNRAVFKIKKNEQPDSAELLVVDWRHDIPTTKIPMHDYSTLARAMGPTVDVKVGDIDGDIKEDFVFLRRATGSHTIDNSGIAYSAGVWVEHFDLADCSAGSDDSGEDYCAGFDPDNPDIRMAWRKFDLENSADYAALSVLPRLALLNIDADSIIVEKGPHSVYTGDNSIVALLTAPPCSDAIGQDTGDCATEFGHGSTNSWEDGVYVNSSVGVVVGAEWEPEINIPFLKIKLAKIELEGALGAEGGYQHNWGLETSELITYSGGADNNLVVFESYIYDRYEYIVLSHPDVSLIGTNINISLPTGRRQLAVSQEYYNDNNGTQIDIDDSILSVIPGDLSSYPNKSEAQNIANSTGNTLVAMSDEHTVVPEGGSNSVSIEAGVSTSETNEFSVGAYVSASGKTCGPDASGINPNICVGIESTTSIGYAHSHTWSTDLVFAGTITGIPSDLYAENNFGMGLFTYKTNLSDDSSDEQQQFIIINYFLER